MATVRERRRKQTLYENARRGAGEGRDTGDDSPPADPGEWFHELDALIETGDLLAGDRVVAYVRVSGREQERNGTLGRHQSSLRNTLKERGLGCVGGPGRVFAERGLGSSEKLEKRVVLEKAVEAGIRAGCKHIVTLVGSRLVRAAGFHPIHNPRAAPTRKEVGRLLTVLRGLVPVAVLPPGSTPDEEERFLSESSKRLKKERGMGAKRKYDTPSEKRNALLPTALSHWREGRSLDYIARTLGITKSIAQKWVDRFGKTGKDPVYGNKGRGNEGQKGV